jgi:hypothetical protein
VDAETATCWVCERPLPVVFAPPNIGGREFSGVGANGVYDEQAGRSFSSAKERSDWATSKGLRIVSQDSRDVKDASWRSKQARDKQAREAGFTDAHSKHETLASPAFKAFAAENEKKANAAIKRRTAEQAIDKSASTR